MSRARSPSSIVSTHPSPPSYPSSFLPPSSFLLPTFCPSDSPSLPSSSIFPPLRPSSSFFALLPPSPSVLPHSHHQYHAPPGWMASCISGRTGGWMGGWTGGWIVRDFFFEVGEKKWALNYAFLRYKITPKSWTIHALFTHYSPTCSPSHSPSSSPSKSPSCSSQYSFPEPATSEIASFNHEIVNGMMYIWTIDGSGYLLRCLKGIW